MSVIDTVTEEITKWLLKKVDNIFSNREPTYEDKAKFLFEVLCMIDDQFSNLKENLFHKGIRIRPINSNLYLEAAQVLNDIKFIVKETTKICPDEYWHDIALHSKMDKVFWDGLRQFFVLLESGARGLYWDSQECGSSVLKKWASDMEEEQAEELYLKEQQLKNELQSFVVENSEMLQNYISALKEDISRNSVNEKNNNY